MITVEQAIESLRPGAEWVLRGDDVEGIVWHTKGVEPLTQAEVEAEVARLEAAAVQAEADRIAAREAAIAKLAALGLTVDDLTALGF